MMRKLSYKRIQIIIVGLIMMASVTMAAEYIWTGNGGDINWSTPLNWQGGTGYPQAAGDIANVTAGNTIHLDVSGITTVGKLQLSGGTPKTVTLTGNAGSALSFSGIAAPNSGFLVDGHAGNRLVVGADIDIAARIDKMGIGAMEFTGAVTSRVAGLAMVLGNGDNLFSGTSSMSFPSSTVAIGNGGWIASVLLTNQAVWRVSRMEMGGASAATTKGSLVQASDDCSLTVFGSMILGQMNSAGNTNSYYNLRKGALTAFEVVVGANSPGSFEQCGGTLLVTNLNVQEGLYRQTGGTSEFVNSFVVGAAGKTPRVALQGGTLKIKADITTAGIASEQAFHFSGGTLQVAKVSSSRIPLRVSGNPVFDMPIGGGLTIREGIAGNANIVKTGAAGLGMEWKGAPAMLSGSLTISNGYFSIPAGVEMGSYAGSADPLAVTICSGGILRLTDITSNITVPLALDIESGGKIEFTFGGVNNRGIVVAHTLATNGVPLLPGRYTSVHGFVTGGSIIVPHVWTGDGDGESWNDAANWADGVVPDDATASADLSRAQGTVRLDNLVTLTCLSYNPQGPKRELTLTGDGSLTLSVPFSLSPGMFVSSGRSLTLDVPLAWKAGGPAFAITGGGTIIIKKGFPGQPLVAGYGAAFSLNATLVFAGETAMGNTFLGLWRHELNGEGTVIFTNGCDLTCQRLLNNPGGFYALRRVYHDGGDVTCGDLIWTRHQWRDASPHAYYMRSGTLTTLNNNGICLGIFYASGWTRYPGGEFVMSGGTVTTYRLAMGMPDNLFDLHGGTLNLGAGGIISTTNVQGAVKLGGLTLRSTANWSSALALELSGINGSAILDTAGRTVTLNGALSGAGGLIKAGTGTLNLNGATNTFTSPLVVAGGNVVCGAASVFNGVSSIIITNGTLELNGEVVSPGLSVRVAGTGSLILPAGYDLQVDRLWLDNNLLSAGTYTFGAGTVTVRANTQIVWTGDAADGAKWSTLNNWENTTSAPDGADVGLDLGYSQFETDDQIVLDVIPGVTLTNLVFDQGLPGHTLTITCPASTTNTLTFSADGIIRVEEGQTLILDTDLFPAGNLYKDGLGTLILNRRTWSDNAAAVYRLYISEGRVINRGAINALNVQPSSASLLATPPEFAQEGDRAAMRDKVFALPGYYYGSNNRNERGLFTQAGGIVDFSTIPDWVVNAKLGFMLAGGGGTEGVYNLMGGELISCPSFPAYVAGNYARGTFNQSGGTSTFHNLTLSMTPSSTGDGYGEVNLSGGTLRLSGTVLKGKSAGSINLSGGRVETLADGAVFAADVPVTLATGASGDVTFAQASAAFVNTLPGTLSGTGGLTQDGLGTLVLNGFHTFSGPVTIKDGILRAETALSGTTDVWADGGRLELLAETPCLTNLNIRAASATVLISGSTTPFPAGMTLSLAQGVVTELDFADVVDVDRLVLGGIARMPGLYGGPDSAAPLKSASAYFTGTGTLNVLYGPQASGTLLMLR